MIPPWHDQFTQARVLVGPVRIPRTANGQKLMKLPRVEAMDLHDPLPQFKGQLDAVLFTAWSVRPTTPRLPRARPTPSSKCSRRWRSS